MVAPEVAREQHRATARLDGHARGAQDVAARVAGDRRHRLGTRKDTTGRIAEVGGPPAVTTDDNGRPMATEQYRAWVPDFVAQINAVVVRMEQLYTFGANLQRVFQIALVALAVLATAALIRFFCYQQAMPNMSPPRRRFAPATARNRDPILDVLGPLLPESGLVLEVASGTGEHVVHFAQANA